MFFGRLTADPTKAIRKSGLLYWPCVCSCGTEKLVRVSHLKGGKIQSCGCLQRDLIRARKSTHGMTRSREYLAWLNMRNRCYQSTNISFPNYGGRGITVCDEWRRDFTAFFAFVGPCPSGHSLERLNNEGNYEPGNVRWATRTEQQFNKRTNRPITWKGRTQTICQWADELGISRTALGMRLGPYGWSVHDALSTPVRLPISQR